SSSSFAVRRHRSRSPVQRSGRPGVCAGNADVLSGECYSLTNNQIRPSRKTSRVLQHNRGKSGLARALCGSRRSGAVVAATEGGLAGTWFRVDHRFRACANSETVFLTRDIICTEGCAEHDSPSIRFRTITNEAMTNAHVMKMIK